MRTPWLWRGCRALPAAFLLVVCAPAPAAATAGPNVALLSSNGWTEPLGASKLVHLVAEVQNIDQVDASQVAVQFNLYRADNSLIGVETSTTDTVASVLGQGGERSPVAAIFPAPDGYHHFTVTTPPSAAVSPTAPDHHFAVQRGLCPDINDAWHVCGTITNLNPVSVDFVRVIFTFYSDVSGSAIVDGTTDYLRTDAQSSLGAGASDAFELVRSAYAPGWTGLAMFGESSSTTPEAPRNVTAVAGNRQATVSWSAPPDGGKPITSYTVVSSPDGVTTSSTAAAATVSGLRNGIAYTFTVTATNALGTSYASAPSAPVVPATKPDAPGNVSAVAGNASATVNWSKPFDEGSAITGYTVTASPGGATQSAGAGATSLVFSGLTNGTAYTFTVQAINAFGAGPPSAASNAVTPIAPPGAPGSVTAVAGNASAGVSWSAPASDGGSAITSYTVTATPGGQTATTTGTSTTVSGLNNGTSYRFSVRAHNAAGDGPASSLSNAVTPTGPGPHVPSWQPWDTFGGVLTGRPTAYASSSRLDEFMVGTDGHVWHRWQDSSVHWEMLGGQPASPISVVSLTPTNFDLFYRNSDGALMHLNETNGRLTFDRVGGLIASEPAAITTDGTTIDVFVQGTDNQLWRARLASGWSWTAYPGILLGGAPTVVSNGAGDLNVFVQGADRGLSDWTTNPASPGWHILGGQIAARPAAVASGGSQLDVFVAGTDFGLWHWSNASLWDSVGGVMMGAPSALTSAPGRLDAFVRGVDNGLWHAWITGSPGSPGSAWQWEGLGGQLSSSPSAVSGASNRMDVLVRNGDGSLGHRAYN